MSQRTKLATYPEFLILLLLSAVTAIGQAPSPTATLPDVTALTDLGTGTYKSFQGGLYENGSNVIPADHAAAVQSAANQIQPLDVNGNPSPTGRIVLLGIGPSTVADEWSVFVPDYKYIPDTFKPNPLTNHATLTVINGAQQGKTTCHWVTAFGLETTCPVPPGVDVDISNQYDRVQGLLTKADVSEAQVQAVWFENCTSYPGGWPCTTDTGSKPCKPLCNPTQAGCSNTPTTTDAVKYEQQMGQVFRSMRVRWPNLKVIFLGSRIYAGYSIAGINPEVFAYEYGFGTKWVIEAQTRQERNLGIDTIAGDLSNGVAPELVWATYPWANGVIPRSDGLYWCEGQTGSPCNGEVDFNPGDGIHPNLTGDKKVSNMVMNYFLNSPYSTWFKAQ